MFLLFRSNIKGWIGGMEIFLTDGRLASTPGKLGLNHYR